METCLSPGDSSVVPGLFLLSPSFRAGELSQNPYDTDWFVDAGLQHSFPNGESCI